MAQVAGTTDTFDLVGIAEDVEDIIYNISPTDTPVFTTARKGKATATNHQWQTDALAAAGSNRQVEGDDATFTTATPTTMLANRTQIARKTLVVSETADAVRKYGRDTEFAYQIAKYGKEIKRDIEWQLVGNQASSAGGSTTARSAAGLESIIAGNVIRSGASQNGASPGFVGGDWTAPTDGTATGAGSTITEDNLKAALELAWQDGGDTDLILTNTYQKRQIANFVGAAKFAGNYNDGGKALGILVAGVSVYISDFGEHKIKLDRFMRQRTLFCLDTEYLELAWLRSLKTTPLAKTGDAEKAFMRGEWTLVVGQPDAHAKVVDLFSV